MILTLLIILVAAFLIWRRDFNRKSRATWRGYQEYVDNFGKKDDSYYG
jgi:hypothetical protein